MSELSEKEISQAWFNGDVHTLRAEIEWLRADRERLIALLAKARGPQGETHERVAEWLRGQGYVVTHVDQIDRVEK